MSKKDKEFKESKDSNESKGFKESKDCKKLKKRNKELLSKIEELEKKLKAKDEEIETVEKLNNDVQHLLDMVMGGSLGKRIDSDSHEGLSKELSENFNKLLDVFNGFMDNLPIPVIAFDKEFTIKWGNKLAEQITTNQKGEMVGTKCYNQFNAKDCNTSSCACGEAMRTGNLCDSTCQATPRGLGKTLDIKYFGLHLKDRDGNIVGAFEYVLDQTEVATKAREIDAAKKKSDEDFSNFVSSFENIISSVSDGNLEINFNEEDYKDGFKIIASNTNELLSVVKNAIEDTIFGLKSLQNGELSNRITNEYKGDFDAIKQAANGTASTLQELF